MTTARTILITGASSGIGAALARHYAAPGVKLHLAGRNAERLAQVVKDCTDSGARCHARTINLADLTALSAWLGEVVTSPLHLAILNAGIAATRSTPEEGERNEEIDAQVDVNFRSTLIAAQIIGRAMAQQGHGRLALMSSLNGLHPVVEAPTYSATKAGIIAYGQAASEWLEPLGASVSIICPGFVNTAIAARYRGPRPFEVSAEKAAAIIARGLARGHRLIAFPMPLVLMIWMGKLTPRIVRRWILARYTARLDPL
jgi:short-subunit dehydrogenase